MVVPGAEGSKGAQQRGYGKELLWSVGLVSKSWDDYHRTLVSLPVNG